MAMRRTPREDERLDRIMREAQYAREAIREGRPNEAEVRLGTVIYEVSSLRGLTDPHRWGRLLDLAMRISAEEDGTESAEEDGTESAEEDGTESAEEDGTESA